MDDYEFVDYGSADFNYDDFVVPDWGNPSDVDFSTIDWGGPSYVDYLLDENYSHEGGNYPTPGSTQPGAPGTGGSPINIPSSGGGINLGGLSNLARNLLRPSSQGGIFGSGVGALPLLMAMMAMKSRPAPGGGGTTMGYAGPRQYTPQVVQSKYGPVLKYAQGGPVRMEDGGFVITKRAVDGAGGPEGIQKLIPSARMIRGPGTGTSDDVPAVIVGKQGTTPAALSNGEAYVPKRTVQDMGGAQRLYSLMNNLQNRG